MTGSKTKMRGAEIGSFTAHVSPNDTCRPRPFFRALPRRPPRTTEVRLHPAYGRHPQSNIDIHRISNSSDHFQLFHLKRPEDFLGRTYLHCLWGRSCRGVSRIGQMRQMQPVSSTNWVGGLDEHQRGPKQGAETCLSDPPSGLSRPSPTSSSEHEILGAYSLALLSAILNGDCVLGTVTSI